jgi:hypothetical protein
VLALGALGHVIGVGIVLGLKGTGEWGLAGTAPALSVPTVVMGSKSRSGWYFSFGFSEMLIACDPVTPMISVYPSGAARDTASAPTDPPAPARFSMFTACFQA